MSNVTKIHIVYYSMYGHVAKLANAIKEGLDKSGVETRIFRVAETLSDDVLAKMHAPPKINEHPIATPDSLKEADGILFGLPTRFGMCPAQVKALLDATGGLWQSGALVGKPAGIFFSTASQSAGQETTALTFLTQLTHHGMIYVPLGFRSPLLFNNEEVHGGSAYGAGTIAGADGSRQPSKLELDVARVQGESFGKIAKKLAAP